MVERGSHTPQAAGSSPAPATRSDQRPQGCSCGCSSMAEPQSSKLITRVRFPVSALDRLRRSVTLDRLRRSDWHGRYVLARGPKAHGGQPLPLTANWATRARAVPHAPDACEGMPRESASVPALVSSIHSTEPIGESRSRPRKDVPDAHANQCQRRQGSTVRACQARATATKRRTGRRVREARSSAQR